MYKRKLITIIIIIVLLIILRTLSNAGIITNVYLTSNKKVMEINEEVEIYLNVENAKISAYTANIYFDDAKIEFVSGPENINLQNNRIIIAWYDIQGGDGAIEGELEKLIFRTKEEGIANIAINGEFYDEYGEKVETNFEKLEVKINKTNSVNWQTQSNANLKLLSVNQEGMIPDFKSNIYEYELNVLNNVDELEIIAIAQELNAQIEILGNSKLKKGLNIIQINVRCGNDTKTYTIKVTKTDNIELANTNLETLAIENTFLTPAFDNNILQYSVEVSNKINKLNILAIPENETEIVQITGADNLKYGENKVDIVVTAENGITQRKYEINVYKRNEQEEQEYVENQNEKSQKLEQAYKIEKLSQEHQEEEKKQKEKSRNLKKMFIIVFVVILLIISIIGIINKFLKK